MPRMSKHRGRLVAAACALTAALVVTGCSDSEPQPPSVSSTPPSSQVADQKLPLEAYLLSADESGQVQQAYHGLITACMQRFGRTYKSVQPEQSGPRSLVDRRYGVTDADLAARHGYHLPGPSDGDAAGPNLTPDDILVLDGAVRDIDGKPTLAVGALRDPAGKPLPKDGCRGESNRTLGNLDVTAAARELNTRSYELSKRDSRVRAAMRAWSACMSASRYNYPEPLAAVDDPRLSGDAPTPLEIAVAVADVACEERTNPAGTWFAVESAYQKRLIAEHRDALERVQKAKLAQLKTVASVLRG